MRKHFVAAALLFSLLFSIKAFSQGGFATVTGSVPDRTGARVSRVTVIATAVDIVVVTPTLSNKS
jgi:hypothetical protein